MNFESVHRFLNEMVSSRKVAGSCAAVWQGGALRFREFLGEVNERSAFRLASMTKPVTAAALLLCVQDGILRLSDPVSAYLPAYGKLSLAKKTESGYVNGAPAGEVTLWNLLTHTSGIGSGESGDAFYEAFKPQGTDTLASAVDRYPKCPVEFLPGSAQAYSPVFALDVAARVVELATGMNYGEFVKERIFKPLGMHATSYNLTDFRKEDLVLTYRSENGVLTVAEATEHNFDAFPAGYTGGGAGLLSTLDDYCLFAEALRRAYAGEDGIFRPESIREMGKPQLDEKRIAGVSGEFNWGLGVRALAAQTKSQPLTAGSFGWSGAYGTHFWVDPKEELVAVYMHNSATYGGSGAAHTVAFERAVMENV